MTWQTHFGFFNDGEDATRMAETLRSNLEDTDFALPAFSRGAHALVAYGGRYVGVWCIETEGGRWAVVWSRPDESTWHPLPIQETLAEAKAVGYAVARMEGLI